MQNHKFSRSHDLSRIQGDLERCNGILDTFVIFNYKIKKNLCNSVYVRFMLGFSMGHKSAQRLKIHSCIDIYAHSCLKPFLIGRKPCSNRKTHVQIMKFTCRLNMGFGRRHWSK